MFNTGNVTTGEDLAKTMFEKSQEIGEVNKSSFEDAGVYWIKTWQYKMGDTSVIVNAYYDIEGTFEITLNK